MIAINLKKIQNRINAIDQNKQVTLIAVSKSKPYTDLQQAIDAGQRHFGENYLQEALNKIQTLKGQNLIWHFIGAIQSNKTNKITQNFDWVHSVDRFKIAKQLNDQRPDSMKKLNVLLQVNIDNEATKSGIAVKNIGESVMQIKVLKKLSLRGFMCIPNSDSPEQSFVKMKKILGEYADLDVLSMGMSDDFELAIKNGATFVRVGSGIFGKRV